MPQVIVDNPIVAVVVILLMVLLGWGGKGYWLNLRKDKREAADDEVDLTAAVRKVARTEIAAVAKRAAEDRRYYDEQLRMARRDIGRLEGRVSQLTQLIREAGIEVPAWLPANGGSERGRG